MTDAAGRRQRCWSKSSCRLLFLLAGWLALIPPAWGEEKTVDLQLVLAVDGSASVDGLEFRLQLEGIASAFRDNDVIQAIRAGPLKRIAVALVVWSEADGPKDSLPWHVVEDARSAQALAGAIFQHPRRIEPGATGIGKAVIYAANMIERSGFVSRRRVIDLSGDGVESAFRDWGIPTIQGRSFAVERGITVNALAILNDEPNLESYFRRNLIGGDGAFVMAVENYEDFADAMRRKLLREIRHQPAVSQAPDDLAFSAPR